MTNSYTISAADIALPRPETSSGLPTGRALEMRRSTREFDKERALSTEVVSSLLWACCGINRPADAHRTNPTAMNWQEIDAYYFDSTGVYLYDFAANRLIKKADGDHRRLLAGTAEFSQNFVLDAPAAILLVAEMNRTAGGERASMMAAADAGIASQNINIYCAANGLATVTRATLDADGIRKLLGLPQSALPLLNNPVGYPAQ